MDYYSAFKKKEFLVYVTWMTLVDIMLSKISQSQKDRHCMIPLICTLSKLVELIEIERKMAGKGWGVGNGHTMLLMKNENFYYRFAVQHFA